MPLDAPTSRAVLETKEPRPDQRHAGRDRGDGTVVPVNAGEELAVCSSCRWSPGDECAGVISLQNLDRTNAFRETRRPAADDARRQPERGARERAARPRDAAAERRAGADQQRPGGARRRARDAGDLRPRRRQDPGDLRRPGRRHRHVRLRAGLVHYPYTIERGVRFPTSRRRRSDGHDLAAPRDEARSWSTTSAGNRREAMHLPSSQGEPSLSVLFAPLISGDEVRGRISLQNLDRDERVHRERRPPADDARRSLSVALENARLLHETRQRNAELAIINGVQDALAGELTCGDLRRRRRKIQEIFDAQVVDIAIFDCDRAPALPVPRSSAACASRTSRRRSSGFPRHVLETREPCWSPRHGRGRERATAARAPGRGGGRRSSCRSSRRTSAGRDLAPEPRPEHAFSESDVAAADDARRQPERRARERAALRRDAAAERRAGADQRRAGRRSRRARLQAIYDPSATGSARSSMRRSSTSRSSTSRPAIHFPYTIERGERFPDEPSAAHGLPRSTCWRHARRS